MDIQDYISRDERARRLLRLLPREELALVQVKRYRKGEYLIRAGERAQSLFIVLEGFCNVVRDTEMGCQQVNSRLGYLDTIGLYEIVHGIPRIGAVSAYRDCTALEIHQDVVVRWIDEYPRFLLEISTGIIQRLFSEIDLMNECAKYPAYYGVISNLLGGRELFNRPTPEYDGPVKIDYTRQYLAEAVGKDVRSVNRVIDQLKARGLVTVKHGKLFVDQAQERALQTEKWKVLDEKGHLLQKV